MKFEFSAKTHQGKKRQNNEDFYIIDPALHLAIICDGVGGGPFGEEASRQTAQLIHKNFVEIKADLEKAAQTTPPQPERLAKIKKTLNEAIQNTSREVYQKSIIHPDRKGMSTTLDIALLIGNKAILAHVGDGRIYLIRNHKIYLLTKDHNVANDIGIKKGPYSTVLTRVIGGPQYIPVDILEIEMHPDDNLLLCTDGVYEYCENDDFVQLFKDETDIKKISQNLENEINQTEAKDNHSHIIIRAKSTEPSKEVFNKVEMVRRLPLFKHLNDRQLLKVLSIAHEVHVQKDSDIIQEHTASNEMYLIVKGAADIIVNKQKISQRQAGDIIGEMGLIDLMPRSATVTAKNESILLRFGREDLFKLFKAEPDIGLKVFWTITQQLNNKLREANAVISSLNQQITEGSVLPFEQENT